MPLQIREQSEKIEAIVLNRVERLSWYYFNIDLNAALHPTLIEDDIAALKLVAPNRGVTRPFIWNGNENDVGKLLGAVLRALRNDPEIAAHIFERIFDGNAIENDSRADRGFFGWLNRGHRARRDRIYGRHVGRGRALDRKMIVAEGDSWFQFPSFGVSRLRWNAVRDIVDHLIDMDRYCVRSVASGGDWSSNIHRNREYIPELSRLEPAVFLFSAGGNDLVGSGRIANMVVHPRRERTLGDPLLLKLNRTSATVNGFHQDRYNDGVTLLADEFFDLMNLLFVQYLLFFLNITRSDQLSKTVIFTHGYDYAVPRRRSTARFGAPRRFVNCMVGSGQWLWRPLEEKQIPDDRKSNVVYAMMTEFNELMIRLARDGGFENLYHVDFRGLASDSDWYDEIHLNSKAFGKAADIVDGAIQTVLGTGENPHNKVFSAVVPP